MVSMEIEYYIYIYKRERGVYVCFWLNKTLCVCLFYFWSNHIFIWVIWLLDGMNLGRCHIFSKYFQIQQKSSLREQMMKWQKRWSIIYIFIKSSRKNKWEGKIQKRILLEIRRRICKRCAKGILEYGCYILSWCCLRKVG